VDGIFMNHKGVWLNVVGGHHVVSMLAMLVTSEQLSEALAEVLFTAGLVKFLVELFVALLLVGHVGLVLGVVVMLPSLVSVMAGVLGFRVLEVALIVKFADKVVAHVRVEILWIMVAFGLIVKKRETSLIRLKHGPLVLERVHLKKMKNTFLSSE